jgi:hypothetical protein
MALAKAVRMIDFSFIGLKPNPTLNYSTHELELLAIDKKRRLLTKLIFFSKHLSKLSRLRFPLSEKNKRARSCVQPWFAIKVIANEKLESVSNRKPGPLFLVPHSTGAKRHYEY